MGGVSEVSEVSLGLPRKAVALQRVVATPVRLSQSVGMHGYSRGLVYNKILLACSVRAVRPLATTTHKPQTSPVS